MLEGLAAAVEDLEIGLDPDELTTALSLLSRLTAKVTDAVGDFDAAGVWSADAATSMTAWLRHHGGLTRKDAARMVLASRRLRSLPVTAGAWDDGTLADGQVRAILANVRGATAELFAAHEADLVPGLVPLSVGQVGRAMQHWALHAEALVDDDEPSAPERALHVSETLDGRVVGEFDLDAESGAVVETALRLAESADVEGEPPRSAATRRADALADLSRFFLDHQQDQRGGRHRPHLNVVVDVEGRAAILGGAPLDEVSISRLLCDSTLHRVLSAGRSAILDYGMSTRSVPAPLWNALVVRDTHCRFEGCDRPPAWCEGHHVVHFEHGGPTNLGTLVLLCVRHHHLLHNRGWEAKLLPDAELHVTDPSGIERITHPPP